jgi:hypothetical protein
MDVLSALRVFSEFVFCTGGDDDKDAERTLNATRFMDETERFPSTPTLRVDV